MNWRVLKQVPLAEVQRRLTEYEQKHGSLSLLHDQFTKGRMPPGLFQDYVEWTSMDHSLRAYNEGEDFEYLAEIDMDLTPRQYKKITPKRLELLEHLSGDRAGSINELAKLVGRDVKNVYNDLRLLESLGFVQLEREGRRLVPERLVHEITVLLG